MTYEIKVSTFAKTDRQDIVRYLEQYSVNAPNRFKQELKKYIRIVCENPYIFSENYVNPNYRSVVIYGSYVMFYTVDETAKMIFVYRILHGSQNIEQIL